MFWIAEDLICSWYQNPVWQPSPKAIGLVFIVEFKILTF